jgi:CMP-N-acetylneuraminic acid synthetase
MTDETVDSVVSVVEIPAHYGPDLAVQIVNGRLVSFLGRDLGAGLTRRQDAKRYYSRDGTVYAMRRETTVAMGTLYGSRAVPLVIPRSESLNLDDEEDWQRAEALAPVG